MFVTVTAAKLQSQSGSRQAAADTTDASDENLISVEGRDTEFEQDRR
jgi:hypothetical protein